MKRFVPICIVLCIILFSSCKKTKEVVPAEPTPVKEKIIWQKDMRYTYYNSILIRTQTFTNKIMTAAPTVFSILTADEMGKTNMEIYRNQGNFNFPTCFSENTVANLYPGGEVISFFPTRDVTNSSLYRQVNIRELGHGIVSTVGVGTTDIISSWGCFSNSVNGRVKFMVPCYTSNQQNALLLLELQEWMGAGVPNSSKIQLISSRLIPLPGTYQFIYSIEFINGYFFVYRSNFIGGDDKSYALRITREGEVSYLPDILYVNNYFAAGKDSVGFVDQLSRVFISGDNGNTWSNFNGLPQYVWRITKVKDRFIVFTSNGIVDLDHKQSRWKGLSLEGLPSNDIVAVSYLADTVYVSTLGSGMYKKSYKDFLDDINTSTP
jgi:hypothetical protein